MKIFSYVLLLLVVATTLSAQSITWLQIGPEGGNVTRVAADSSGALFALADNGVYRSMDNGVTWQRDTTLPTRATRHATAECCGHQQQALPRGPPPGGLCRPVFPAHRSPCYPRAARDNVSQRCVRRE